VSSRASRGRRVTVTGRSTPRPPRIPLSRERMPSTRTDTGRSGHTAGRSVRIRKWRADGPSHTRSGDPGSTTPPAPERRRYGPIGGPMRASTTTRVVRRRTERIPPWSATAYFALARFNPSGWASLVPMLGE
jgi:hypothetical protein